MFIKGEELKCISSKVGECLAVTLLYTPSLSLASYHVNKKSAIYICVSFNFIISHYSIGTSISWIIASDKLAGKKSILYF